MDDIMATMGYIAGVPENDEFFEGLSEIFVNQVQSCWPREVALLLKCSGPDVRRIVSEAQRFLSQFAQSN